MDLTAVEHTRVGQGALYTGREGRLTAWDGGQTALAGVPVASGEVEEYLLQTAGV